MFTDSNIRVERAVPIVGNIIRDTGWIADHMKNAAAEAAEADVTVLCLGLESCLEVKIK